MPFEIMPDLELMSKPDPDLKKKKKKFGSRTVLLKHEIQFVPVKLFPYDLFVYSPMNI
jgi:hypothetical protein